MRVRFEGPINTLKSDVGGTRRDFKLTRVGHSPKEIFGRHIKKTEHNLAPIGANTLSTYQCCGSGMAGTQVANHIKMRHYAHSTDSSVLNESLSQAYHQSCLSLKPVTEIKTRSLLPPHVPG